MTQNMGTNTFSTSSSIISDRTESIDTPIIMVNKNENERQVFYSSSKEVPKNTVNDSVSKVRKHLEDVINNMDSEKMVDENDSDNVDTSMHSSASIISSVVQIKKVTLDKNPISNNPMKTINKKNTLYHYPKKQVQKHLSYVSYYDNETKCQCKFKNCHNGNTIISAKREDVNENIQDQIFNPINKPSELYRIEMEQSNNKYNLPKRFIFDLVDNLDNSPATLNKGIQYHYNDVKIPQKKFYKPKLLRKYLSDENVNTFSDKEQLLSNYDERPKKPKLSFKKRKKVDIYYFDHGNSEYYRTTDSPPIIATDELAEKTELFTTKFWAEIFGSLHIGCSFFTSFIIQFLRFILYSLIRPLTIGLLQLLSDYFFKPFLAVSFNSIIQPILILFVNIAVSLRDLAKPIAESFGYFLHQIAEILRAIRLIEIKNVSDNTNKKNNEQISSQV